MQDQGANVAWQHLNGLADGDPINYSEIDCVINDEYKVACRREGQEVYLPFSFVGKYFEVSVIFPVILFHWRQEIKVEFLQELKAKSLKWEMLIRFRIKHHNSNSTWTLVEANW